MKKVFFVIIIIAITFIFFISCKKANSNAINNNITADTTEWAINGVTDTATGIFQTFNVISISDYSGDELNITFGSLPYGNQTYTVVSSNVTPNATQCNLNVITGNNNITYYSTGAIGNKVTLTTGNREVFTFSNITVSGDSSNKTVSGTIIE
jgi:hypothetical protein